MIETRQGDLRLLQFEGLSRHADLVHAVSTRPVNLASHRGRDHDRATGWRRQICDALNLGYDRLTAAEQIHSPDIVAIEESDIGRGRDGRASAVKFVDGLITDRVGVPMLALSADCPIVMAYDPVRRAIGAVHASWRGTLAGAAANLVHQLHRVFGSDPGDLQAAVAPSAGPCCYEVGIEVRRVMRTRFERADDWFVAKGGRIHLDLWQANHDQLLAAGVRPAHVETARVCSICDDRLWSHRRDGTAAGRFGVFMALR